eukprot:ANDGO_08386.mRNA.1 Beta-(1
MVLSSPLLRVRSMPNPGSFLMIILVAILLFNLIVPGSLRRLRAEAEAASKYAPPPLAPRWRKPETQPPPPTPPPPPPPAVPSEGLKQRSPKTQKSPQQAEPEAEPEAQKKQEKGQRPRVESSIMDHSEVDYSEFHVFGSDEGQSSSVSAPMSSWSDCERKMGYGWLKTWLDASQTLVSPRSSSDSAGAGAGAGAGGKGRGRASSTTVDCGMASPGWAPPATHPHTWCRASNLIIDYGKRLPLEKLKYRDWMPSKEKTLFDYRKGALQGINCRLASASQQWFTDLSKDHFQDIFSSFECSSDSSTDDQEDRPSSRFAEEDVLWIEDPVLFVTREYQEHRNTFHSMTDMTMVHATIRMFGLDDQNWRVVLLDNHGPSPYDQLWKNMMRATKSTELTEFTDATKEGLSSSAIGYRNAFFVPPGYHSYFFADMHADLSCDSSMNLAKDFASFMRNSFNQWIRSMLQQRSVVAIRSPAFLELMTRIVQHEQNVAVAGKSPVLVLLSSRRPYEGHTFMDRRIANEDDLADEVKKAHPEVHVSIVDMANLPFLEQVLLIRRHHVWLAMHGGGTANILYLLPEHITGRKPLCFEIFRESTWRVFEHLSKWLDFDYAVWTASPSDSQRLPDGSVTTVHPEAVVSILSRYL